MISAAMTFPGGVHPPHFKKPANKIPIKKAALPKQVVIPLSQHIGAICEPLVSVGDKVKPGILIGKSDKFVSSFVHASVSGEVIKIEQRPHPLSGLCNSVVIESDGTDEAGFTQQESNADSLKPQEIIDIIRRSGVVGLGGACFPTHVKLTSIPNKKIDTFVLNGAECEPYLSCDHRLMLERPKDIIKGMLLIMKAIGVTKGFVAIEDNKPDAVEAMRAALNSTLNTQHSIQIVTLKTKYPQGAEKQIIKVILNKEVPAGGLPFDVGCLVDNVATALAVYEAVYYKKPLYERVITVCGDAVKEQANLLVRIGTRVSDILQQCGLSSQQPGKIIFGGPMMGFSQYTTDVPVIKGTSGIIFLSQAKVDKSVESVCIRCGNCLDVCPMKLAPTTLMNLIKLRRYAEAKEIGVDNCYECGSCAYECPAKIPLVDYMKLGKNG